MHFKSLVRPVLADALEGLDDGSGALVFVGAGPREDLLKVRVVVTERYVGRVECNEFSQNVRICSVRQEFVDYFDGSGRHFGRRSEIQVR